MFASIAGGTHAGYAKPNILDILHTKEYLFKGSEVPLDLFTVRTRDEP